MNSLTAILMAIALLASASAEAQTLVITRGAPVVLTATA